MASIRKRYAPYQERIVPEFFQDDPHIISIFFSVYENRVPMKPELYLHGSHIKRIVVLIHIEGLVMQRPATEVLDMFCKKMKRRQD